MIIIFADDLAEQVERPRGEDHVVDLVDRR
jgi:hypothetical protein